jgi:hypothetical protein
LRKLHIMKVSYEWQQLRPLPALSMLPALQELCLSGLCNPDALLKGIEAASRT